jgi:hypothetical protein
VLSWRELWLFGEYLLGPWRDERSDLSPWYLDSIVLVSSRFGEDIGEVGFRENYKLFLGVVLGFGGWKLETRAMGFIDGKRWFASIKQFKKL